MTIVTPRQTERSTADTSGQGSIEQLLHSILDLTVSMEQSAESEDFETVVRLMGRRETLLGEFSGLDKVQVQDAQALDLIKAIHRENTVLMAQLQQKRDAIAVRLQEMKKERAIAQYRH